MFLLQPAYCTANMLLQGLWEIQYPGYHMMGRWETEIDPRDSIQAMLVGRQGDELDFSTLPARLRTAEMASALGVAATASDVVRGTRPGCGVDI